MAVLAGVLIHRSINSGNGKVTEKTQEILEQEAPQVVSEFEKGVKKFFNLDNKTVENVILDKNLAKNAGFEMTDRISKCIEKVKSYLQ